MADMENSACSDVYVVNWTQYVLPKLYICRSKANAMMSSQSVVTLLWSFEIFVRKVKPHGFSEGKLAAGKSASSAICGWLEEGDKEIELAVNS